jgi:hypothetical protein
LSTANDRCNHDSDRQAQRRHSFDRTMFWDASLNRDLVERIWGDPQALLAEGNTLQDKLRCTVTRIDHPAGPFVWKHHNWGSWGRTLRRSLSRSVARKAWLDGRLLLGAGIPTPRPRAFIEIRIGPFKTTSYFLADYVAGTSLYRLMRFAPPPMEVVRHLAEQVAAIWQQLDDLRVCHNDFKTENLLVDPQGKVWLIDLDRLRRCRRVDDVRRRQIRDAGDLLHPRNWRTDPAAAELFRREIVKTPAATAALASPLAAKHPLSRPAPTTNRAEQLITVLIACHNSANTIAACLESVRDTADEILVADAGSTDETLRIVRKFGGCRVIERDGPDDADFEAWAHEQARHPWILRILPEEQLNPELARKVQDMLATEPNEDGFRVGRTHFYRGQRLKLGGYHHDTSIRLYRKQSAHYESRDGRVEVTVNSRKIGTFQPRLFYESCPSIAQRLSAMIQVTVRAAEDADRQGLSPQRWKVLWKAPWQFVRTYFLRGGWLDGWAGLHASCLAAFSVYLREAMHWELANPVAVRRSDATNRWQESMLFDPGRTTELPIVASADPRTMPEQQAAAVAVAERPQVRSAA